MTDLIIGWVEPDASICMFVCLVVGVLLEQEVSTVAMNGGSFLGQVALLADVQGFKVSFQSSLVVLKVLVVVFSLSIQLSYNLLLCGYEYTFTANNNNTYMGCVYLPQ